MRHGSTLMEMLAMLMVAGLIFTGAFEVLGRLQRMAGADATLGARAEGACDLLRRDLAAGPATVAGGELRIAHGASTVVWHAADGALQRDGRLLLSPAAFTLEERGGQVLAVVTPAGLPPRRIEVRR